MQTCSRCDAISPDDAKECVNCHADLGQYSITAVALKRMQENPRVRAIRVSVAGDACSHCYELMQTFPKNKVPLLPHRGCSHVNGCRCMYEPVLDDTAIVGEVASADRY